MTAYYNENDPHAAAWLRELIAGGHIAPGDVDERSIIEVSADDVKGYTQQHFFAGLGGWSYAARLSGWPDDKPLFTGSPPCQPFSTAGKQLGKEDARHLAPHWLELVRTVRPHFVAGEQVAAAVNKDAWLDDLLDALEAENYATGAIVLPASFVGSSHIRQRIWFVGRMGNGEYEGLEGFAGYGNDQHEQGRLDTQPSGPAAETGSYGGMAHNPSQRHDRGEDAAGQEGRDGAEIGGDVCGLADADSYGRKPGSETAEAARYGGTTDATGSTDRYGSARPLKAGWNNPDWLFCRDGKWRPVESGTFPLVNGLPRGVVYSGDPSEPGYANQTAEARVMRLKGYGNAIVPQVAAEVLRELMQDL